MTLVWNWPQIVVAVMTIFSMGVSLARYGQPKRDTYDIIDVLLAPALSVWILYMGGFWTGAHP